jgi:HupE / UreJ protein
MRGEIITRLGGLCAMLLLLFAAFPASAHLSSDSYLRIEAGDQAMSAQWDIALRDLDVAIGLDADGDGNITWGEVKAKRREIEAYALSHLSIEGGAGSCLFTPNELLADRHADGGYAVLRFAIACPAGTKVLTIRYRLLFDLDPTHRGLLTVSDHGSASTAILSPTQPSDTIVLGDAGASGVLSFVRLGIEHILGGRDHLLFLAVLLLPALGQVRRSGIRTGLFEAAGLLSLFTLAHAVTVTLAVLRVIEVPGRLSEAAIAFSIAVTAADNIRPFMGERRGVIAFGFGLIHGLGFASALGPLALTGWKLVLALAGFNTGIELVQLSLALIAFGAAWTLSRHRLDTLTQWRRFKEVPILCSLTIFALSAYWFADRAFLGAILR